MTYLTTKCSIDAQSHIRSHDHVSFKIKLFCKPIAITLNIMLYKFIVSRVYGIISAYSEYINGETMSPIIFPVCKQINL